MHKRTNGKNVVYRLKWDIGLGERSSWHLTFWSFFSLNLFIQRVLEQ